MNIIYMSNLLLKIIDKKSNKMNFDSFMTLYKKNNKDLCLKKNGIKTQHITVYLNNFLNLELYNYSIYYIIKKNNNQEKILAFCLISINEDYKIIDITLLCSNKEKNKINGNSLGKYLLNIIYHKYINDNYIIRIQPATPALINYYKEWRSPNFSEIIETYGNLLYGNLKSAEDKTLKKIFQSLSTIDKLKEYLYMNITTKNININNLKIKLKERLDHPDIKIKYNKTHYNQILNMINGINFLNCNDIRNHSIPL